jgi:hypothetical protein
MTLYRLNIIILSSTIMLMGLSANAQIVGSNAVTFNAIEEYTYSNGNSVNKPTWTITNGTPLDFPGNFDGLNTYSITVKWNIALGLGSVRFRASDGPLGTLNVTVGSCGLGAPTTNSESFARCGSGVLTLQATPGSGGNNIRWYTAATGGSPVTGTSYTTTSQNVSGAIFYLTTFNSSTLCESSPRVAASVTINSIPGDANVVSQGSTCGPGNVTLTASPATGSVAWYSNNTSGTAANGDALWTGQTYTPYITSTTAFWIGSLNNATGCETKPANRIAITGTVKPIPIAAASNQTICSGQSTSISINNTNAVSGTTYNWAVNQLNVSGAISGSGNTISQTLNATTTSAGIATYTITPLADGCSGSLTTTTVTVNPKPTVTITNPIAVYTPRTVDLTSGSITSGSTSGLTYTYWTDANTTAILSTPNAVSMSGTYYIKGAASNGCSAIKPVTVVVYPSPAQIGGQNVVTFNSTAVYTYSDGGTVTGPTWQVTNGTALTSSDFDGFNTYSMTVKWDVSLGAGSVRFRSTQDGLLGTLNITVNGCGASAPTIDSRSFARCGPGALTLQATSGSGGNTVRWYTSATGGTFIATGTSFAKVRPDWRHRSL